MQSGLFCFTLKIPDMTKTNAGDNAPAKYTTSNSAEYIKRCIREDADATCIQNGWYKVYVEQIDENTMRVYMFYA